MGSRVRWLCVLSLLAITGAAVPVVADGTEGVATLSLAVTRDDFVPDLVSNGYYRVLVPETQAVVSEGVLVGSWQGHRRQVSVPAGRYEVELAPREIIGAGPRRFGPLSLVAREVTELTYRVPSGTLEVGLIRAGGLRRGSVEIRDAKGDRVSGGSVSSDLTLVPGRYQVIANVGPGERRRALVEIHDGETTEVYPVLDRDYALLVERGNVFLLHTSGAKTALSESGLDRWPAVSPRGDLVAFVRRTPGYRLGTGSEMAEATELWVTDLASLQSRRLVRGRPAADMSQVIAAISNLGFSPDGKTIYFETAAWAVSGAIHRVDVATQEERFVCPGNGYAVIREGLHAGNLRVVKHKYRPRGQGSYDAELVVNPDGRELEQLRIISED